MKNLNEYIPTVTVIKKRNNPTEHIRAEMCARSLLNSNC